MIIWFAFGVVMELFIPLPLFVAELSKLRFPWWLLIPTICGGVVICCIIVLWLLLQLWLEEGDVIVEPPPFSMLPPPLDFSDACSAVAESELRKLPVVEIICQLPTDRDDDDSWRCLKKFEATAGTDTGLVLWTKIGKKSVKSWQDTVFFLTRNTNL